ncbi:unnamed protein product [Anisakis simplex]|uniref:Uncharacterized protein n=1 Tax=Anisakis simplex TaxID=6269 RepID=A0A3P6QYW2_ANISI|nr:unnamed protein product [Anisakis simplex]
MCLQVSLECDWRKHSAFLVTLQNRMDLHTTCSTIGTLMTFNSAEETFPVGCIHYMVHLFSSPLNVTFLSVRAIPDHITVAVSAVRFSCVPFDPVYRQCKGYHPQICIARTLFCDGYDNCGRSNDEKDCDPDDQETYTQLTITILDDQNEIPRIIICVVVLIILMCIFCCVYIWRYRIVRRRKFQSRCLRKMLGLGESDHHENQDETVALLAYTLSTQWLPYMNNNVKSNNHR